MFGYIRPVQPELRVRELDLYKACYCGLCHTMGGKYGLASRFLLNYDFVFLAMLLWTGEMGTDTCKKRCIGCPHKKKVFCKNTPALEKCAGMSIILYWWKIQDSVADEGFFKAGTYRFLGLLLKRAYKRAAADFPEYDAVVKASVSRLSALEAEKCGSIDETADCFAVILREAASAEEDIRRRRILQQVLYHTGRWIYIADACDDFAEDIASGSYNPVSERFNLHESPAIPEDIKKQLNITLMSSRNQAGNSFELLEETAWSDIIRNIIFLGMPGVAEAVLGGMWKKKKRKSQQKNGNVK